MGKKSTLRVEDKPQETRHQYSNGDRKFYDKDKAPEGADFDTWHLTLLFEQLAEKELQSLPGRIIVYTHLRSRIEQFDMIQEDNGQWVEILEAMIRKFWDDYTGDFPLSDFCDAAYFAWCHQWILDTRKREKLRTTGVLVTQETPEKKPAKQSSEDLEILYRKYTEDELQKKMREFKSRKLIVTQDESRL